MSGLLVVLPEIVLRLVLFEIDRPRPATLCAWPAADAEMQDVGYFLQPDKDSFYDLRPGAAYSYFGTPMDSINRDGFRGPSVPKEHAGCLRIVCLGDSSTFGMCVSEALTWPRQLEGLLRERRIGKPIDVINAGVIGYSVFQGVRKYESKVRPYKPDIAVLAFGAINDQMPAGDAPDLERAARWDESFHRHVQRAADYLWKLRTVQCLGQGLLESQARARREMIQRIGRNMYEFEHGAPYTPRLSHEEFQQCLAMLVDETRRDRCIPILVNPHRRGSTEEKYPQLVRLSEIILEMGAEQGVPIVDCNSLFKRNPNYEHEYFADTHHPNAQGNRLIAEALAEMLATLVDRDRPVDN